ncbi:MAG TPA: LysR substrate-binding domain-containing protein, partial [Pseudonocardiaceae bacterium]|nr:LysR substrate-binding domain-containing protein [Pseudonocardiaceae bacterium]
DLRVALSEQEPHESIPALSRGQVDIAIVQDWADDELTVPDNLSRRHLTEDTLDLAVPADHRLAGQSGVALADLLDEDWIGWSATQICHDWLIHTLRITGTQPRIVHTASEHSTQLAFVAARLGVALIPRLGREPVTASVRFVPVTGLPVRRIHALWRTSASARPAISAAVDVLRRHGDGR